MSEDPNITSGSLGSMTSELARQLSEAASSPVRELSRALDKSLLTGLQASAARIRYALPDT
jgi:hypothetical protein